ncbi:PrsW family glutamic-type intramembrane protease [Couchioplanes caeruleus]|nr:PrsW family glutamic-type intramembrane protease [Couchioplanes caeruleus]ROP27437.1 RsiW-degrading membrane proteinase PrsW (M82 family) [Couchioplanes caeruleus]
MANPPWSPARTPAFWILGGIGALSTLGVIGLTVFLAVSAPRAAAVSLPLAVVFAAFWLAALLGPVDPVERRPVWLVAAALAWGASVAVAVGAAGGYVTDLLLAKAIGPSFAAQWGPAIVAPYAEEIGKGAGVVLVLLMGRPYVITVWSGALYGAVVGVGFALAEDVSYALTAADDVLPDDAGAAVSTLLLRMAVPGLVGHPLFTATAGAGIAYAWLRRDRSRRHRLGVLAAAASGAALMHAVVNSPVAAGATELLATVPGSSAMAGYLLVVTGAAVPALRWLQRTRRADARALLAGAAALAPAAIRPEEVPILAGVRTRLASWWRIRREHGAETARGAARLSRAQLRLAAASVRPYRGYAPTGPYGPAPTVQWWLDEAVAARRALPQAAAAPPETGPDVASGRATTAVAVTTLAAAVAGLLCSPVAAVALAGAVALRWRRGRGRLATTAVAAAVAGAYCALATVLVNALFG